MKRFVYLTVCAAICSMQVARPAAPPPDETPATPAVASLSPKIDREIDAYLTARTGAEMAAALEVMKKSGPPAAASMIARLRSELLRGEPRPEVVGRLGHALVKLGAPSLPGAVSLMRDLRERPAVRAEAARIVAQIQGQRSLFALVELLVDALAAHPAPLAARLIEILGDMNDARPIPSFEQALQNDDPSVRFAAAAALGKLAHPEVTPFLLRALDDRDVAVRSAANRALIRLSGVDQGFEADAPAADRAAAAMRWARWWEHRPKK